MDRRLIRDQATQLIERFNISCPQRRHAPMWSLSGGNQQRVVLARELSHNPRGPRRRPTDAWPRRRCHRVHVGRLRAAAADGVAVLLISTELEEVLDLADRIVVMFRGQAAGAMRRGEVDIDRLGLLMGGATHE